MEEVSDKVFCPQCKRTFEIESLRAKCNTILTDVQLACPHCRRRLRKMRLKEWYDQYVHGKTPEFKDLE